MLFNLHSELAKRFALCCVLTASCAVGYVGTREAPSEAHNEPQGPMTEGCWTEPNATQPGGTELVCGSLKLKPPVSDVVLAQLQRKDARGYAPVQVRSYSITVDCDDPRVFCDDEGS